MSPGYRHRHHDLGDIKLPQNLIGHVQIPLTQTQKEISLSYPQIESIYVGRGALAAKDSLNAKSCIIVVPVCKTPLNAKDKTKLAEWLKLRLSSEDVVLFPVSDKN